MTSQQVLTLMLSSQTETEWNANCDRVKVACGGYPSFWWETIMVSGVAAKVAARWGGDDQIRVGGGVV
jgi:hypothetical protein